MVSRDETPFSSGTARVWGPSVIAGLVCGLALSFVVHTASEQLTTLITPPAALRPISTHAAATASLFGARSQPRPLSRTTALASVAGASRAPLDPLHLTSPEPPITGPAKVLLVLAGVVLFPVIALVLLVQKLCKTQARVGLEDVIYDHRISMAAVAAEEETKAAPKSPSKKSLKPKKEKFSKRRRALEALYQKKQLYSLDEALDVVKKTSSAKFVESVDVAINLGIDPRKSDQMVRGSVVLPGGTGKVVRVAAFCQGDAIEKAKAAGAEFFGLQDLADLIKGGEMGFDVVVATPDSMRVALQLGKILGPRGLMPNPKDGTVNVNIEEAVRNAKAGQVKYRCDKGGTVHCPVGKSNFDITTLKTNVNAVLKDLLKAKPATAKGVFIKKVVVSASMGPGVYVDPSSTDARL